MEPQSQLTTSKQIIEYLTTRFPNCFTREGDTKPLKIGIFQDIVEKLNGEEIVSKTKLRVALKIYTMSWRYLYSIKEGEYRVDLDGVASEKVTQEQIEHAKQQLKESKARAKEKMNNKRKTAPVAAKPNTAKAARPTTQKTIKTVKTENVAKTGKPNTLQVGDIVQVVVSSKPISAHIIQIEKDQIRVRVTSGMELTVKAENIISN